MQGSYIELYKRVKSSFKRPGLFDLPFVEHLKRELSFFITPLFLKWDVTPNQASCLNYCIGVAAAILISIGYHWSLVAGLVIFFISEVVDRVDGNIARTTGTSSFFGKFLDGLFDIATFTLLSFALSVYVYINSGSGLLFWLGGINTVLTPFQHFILDRYSAYARWINESSSLQLKPYIRLEKGAGFLNILFDLQYVVLVLAIFNYSWGICLYFLINVVTAKIQIYNHVISASKNMRVSKKSPKQAQDYQVLKKG